MQGKNCESQAWIPGLSPTSQLGFYWMREGREVMVMEEAAGLRYLIGKTSLKDWLSWNAMGTGAETWKSGTLNDLVI